MASVYDLKPKFQNLLRPFCDVLARSGVTANQVTIAAVLVSALNGAAIACTHGARWALLLMPLILFVRMALNAIDGMLAREFAMKSRLGAVLNEMGDVVSDAVLYLALMAVPGAPALMIAGVVAIAIMVEMMGVVAIQIGAPRGYQGPFGKSDRAVFFGAIALALGLGAVAGPWLSAVLALAALAGLLTIVNRARAALAAS
jgi:CDP-diacylglycerol--glycerol-3-phosphate 3-phosphatidyltransferase